MLFIKGQWDNSTSHPKVHTEVVHLSTDSWGEGCFGGVRGVSWQQQPHHETDSLIGTYARIVSRQAVMMADTMAPQPLKGSELLLSEIWRLSIPTTLPHNGTEYTKGVGAWSG